ncbi:MAG: ATP-grasp domain-containing protein [Rikenellaceae bacterium]|nr:ATP-grasp domain-containing protein [Rikenellaceae bacterium]
MENKCDVIVTYSWNRVGYNILQSLSEAGLKVYVADVSSRNICSYSKFCAGSFTYPDPFINEDEFIKCLLDKIIILSPKVIIPTHDEGIIISKYRKLFPKNVIIPISDYKTILTLSNKVSATKLAKQLNVPTPLIYNSLKDVSTWPIVFKTAIGNSAKGVYFPKNIAEATKIHNQFANIETLIQEKVLGVDYSVDCIRMNNYFFASVYRSKLTKTFEGGTSTQRTIVDNPILVEYSKRILDAVNYYGVCGLDFKFNESTNEAYFIEVNARYTGGLATPIAAGFNIPLLHYQLATIPNYTPKIKIKVGTSTKWILGDIITLVSRIATIQLSWSDIKSIFNFTGFNRFDDYRKDDKKAFIGELIYYFNKFIRNFKLNP